MFSVPNMDSPVFIDACPAASGIFFNGDWQYTAFNMDWPEVAELHINHKEVLSVVLAARRWQTSWANSTVTVFTDNITAKSIINKGACRHPLVMDYLRELFWIAATNNFSIKCVYIRGPSNILADCISRLHEPNQLQYLEFLLGEYCRCHEWNRAMFYLPIHLSNLSYISLLPQIGRFLEGHRTWTKRLPATERQPSPRPARPRIDLI